MGKGESPEWPHVATHNRGDRVGAWLLGVFLWRERWVWFEQIEGVNKIPLKIFITSLLMKNGSWHLEKRVSKMRQKL